MTAVTVSNLTTAAVDGTGVFDVLMKATKAHLESEFEKNRIKGTEYSEVYLGALTQVMQTALQFVLTNQKVDLEAQLLQKQIDLTQAQINRENAQTSLVNQQKLNAEVENTVLVAQECKLRAEYDLTMANITRTNEEVALLTQKTATERAQTTALGVDAEQKVAKVLVDSWNVRRTTDEGTVADATNMLNDAAVGRAVTKLLAGVNA
jgi:hypothetical protein